MSCCDFAGSDQRLGSAAIVFSISANWERREAASKIAPQVMDLAANSGVFAFEFFYHNLIYVVRASSMVPAEILARTSSAKHEITTHIHAKRSP